MKEWVRLLGAVAVDILADADGGVMLGFAGDLERFRAGDLDRFRAGDFDRAGDFERRRAGDFDRVFAM